MRMRTIPILVGTMLLWGTATESTAFACPTCQAGLAEHLQMQVAYAVSIGLLMGVPFLLLGGWCWALFRWSQPGRWSQPADDRLET